MGHRSRLVGILLFLFAAQFAACEGPGSFIAGTSSHNTQSHRFVLRGVKISPQNPYGLEAPPPIVDHRALTARAGDGELPGLFSRSTPTPSPSPSPTATATPCPTPPGSWTCFTVAPGQQVTEDWSCGNCTSVNGTLTWAVTTTLPGGFTATWNPNTSCWDVYPACYAPLTLAVALAVAPQGPDDIGVDFTAQNGVVGGPGGEVITVAYSTAQKIWMAAFNYFGTDTSQIAGTDNGIVACVAALQQILQNAGLSTVGGGTYSVDNFVTALRQGWTNTTGPANGSTGQFGSTSYGVSQADAVQGDFVVQGDGDPTNGQNHVGICENTGCTMILSNASYDTTGLQCTAPCFGWEASPTDFANSWSPVESNGYYHLIP